MSQLDATHERLIETYRKKARHYNVTSRLSPAPGYPQQTYRIRALRALGLHSGDTVVDVACGTGQNFPLLEEMIGANGRIVAVDLTDAMLAQARQRIERNGWRNVSLVQGDAAEFEFPSDVAAVVSTYALSHVPESAKVIARGAAALRPGGHMVMLDLKAPAKTPRWLSKLGTSTARPFGAIDDWMSRRPWETIRAAMQEELDELSWTELFFGTAFLAVGRRGADQEQVTRKRPRTLPSTVS